MLEDRIYRDYIEALKAKDKSKAVFLSFLRSELKNLAINLKKEKLEDKEVLEVLAKQKKRLQDARESIVSSQRADVLRELDKEIDFLNEYLPSLLREDELIQIIEEVISQVSASSLKDMGKVMKEVLTKVGVRAEPKKVSILVKNRLSSSQSS